MQYMDMLPYQVRDAIDRNTPVVLPLGVVEYHGEHLPLGTDFYVAMNAIQRVEQRHPEIVVLPPFYYGCASYAVAGPERNGTVHVDCAHIVKAAEDIFRSLLRVGFRNIHCFIAHQDEGFQQGMPTDLAFRFAAKHVIFQWLEKESGEGWWGTEKFANYYEGSNDPFRWITVDALMTSPELKEKYETDHAGPMETSQMLVIKPQYVQMDRISKELWFCRQSHTATKEFGEQALTDASYEVEARLGYKV